MSPRESGEVGHSSNSSNWSKGRIWHGLKILDFYSTPWKKSTSTMKISQIIIDRGSRVMESIYRKQKPPISKLSNTLFQSYTNLAITMGATCVQFLEDLWPTKKTGESWFHLHLLKQNHTRVVLSVIKCWSRNNSCCPERCFIMEKLVLLVVKHVSMFQASNMALTIFSYTNNDRMKCL